MKRDSRSATRTIDIAFMFSVQVDGFDQLGEFVQVDQIGRSREPFTYFEGGRNRAPHVLFGPGHYDELVLRWGLMNREALWEWMHSVRIGQSFRRNGAIHQYNRAGDKSVRLYTFEGAWPIAWRAPRLDALKSDVPVEELRLAIDRLKVEAYDVE